MKTEDNYLEINRQSWNARTTAHLESDFYDVEGFLKGNSSLKPVELAMLGDIRGKSILHLQCHFGQDSISLAKMGAKVTAVDLSDQSIASAKELAKKSASLVNFICCDIYQLPNHLNEQFDIVFTSYGVISWLPDLDKWAKIISRFLKPRGKLIFVEFHPVVWMFDDNFEKIAYNYLNSGAILETETGTYANKKAEITQEYVMWNHGLGEVINALIKNNMEINSLDEFDYSPYNCLQHLLEVEPGKYRIAHLENKIPMVYAVMATKKIAIT
ncbi:class I SAM-dependent methyltransferase [Pedobacter gandavensis]|uniref:Methyltransferase domain-containing protein n=1 Tax=Pedobacter gandavensis TaxID=2679963 RepID=A0ABR6EU24_9SPHI|nr:class I SAM-dependent methyltransferase [Pedobacter gandavensis]MBB2148770.1 methyltransferase domain-containing protein [Pedobacter gandavensis]